MRFVVRVLAAGLAALSEAPAWGHQTVDACQVEMHHSAVVGAAMVSFDNLADLSGAGECSKLHGLEIKLNSAPGQLQSITRDDLEALIALRFPELSGRIRFIGGNSVIRVTYHGHPLAVDEWIGQAQSAVERGLLQRGLEFEVRPARTASPGGVELAEGEVATLRPLEGELRSRTVVWLDIGHPGEPPRGSIPLWFDVKAWASMPVAAKEIAAGEHLANAAVAIHRIDIAALGSHAAIAPDDGSEPLIAVAPIRAGTPLTEDLFRKADAVEAGDEVRMRVQIGRLAVESHGIALESGINGKRVRVRNAGSGEIVVALVSGRDLVEVMP